MSLFERLERLDRRWIFAVIMLVFVLSILKPVGLALEISDTTRSAFELIDSLPAGSVLWLALDYEPANCGEVESSAYAVFRHAMKKDLRVVSASMWAPGGMMMDKLLQTIKAEFPEKEYGVDFLNLGYRPGGQAFIQKLMEDLPDAVLGIDHYGDKISDYPIAEGLNTLSDVSAVVSFAVGTPGFREYIKIATDPGDIPLVAVLPAVSVPEAMPMVNSGQIKGLLASLRGGAEYEKVSSNPGKALTGMDAQSFVNLAILVFIALGNVGYAVMKKNAPARGQGGKKNV